mgnify:CR=1 FL=1|jgi:ribose/xylose/arabinose/galactoside ABC-type transport system permease subunit
MKKRVPNLSLYILLIAVVVLMTVLNPVRFPTRRNFFSMAYQLPFLAFLSMGQMVPMLAGGINLAIIATTNLTGIVTAMLLSWLSGGSSWDASLFITLVAMAGGVLAALAVGALNGFLIGHLRIPDMLATLGTMTLVEGINIVLTRGYTLTGFPDFLIAIGNDAWGDIPIPFIIFVVLTILLGVLLNKTSFGYSVYMIGSNYTASKFSAIDTRKVIIKAYMLSSVFAAVTSFIMMGQMNSVKANYAESYLLVSILACILGAIDPMGGSGRLSGLVVSVLILQVVSTGVNLLRMDPFFVRAMWGFIVIVVIAMNHYGQHVKFPLGFHRWKRAEQSVDQ